MTKNRDENKLGLGGIILGSLGLAASALAFKKVFDLYSEAEDGKLMSEEEYKEEMKEFKSDYASLGKDEDGEIETLEFFDRSKIVNDSNADKLFKLFLDRVEEVAEIPDKVFKISDIEKLIPMEDTDFSTRSSYNYSIMSMLGGQSSRDYFNFKNTQGLRDIFTAECNKSNRDNLLWKNKYNDEEFIINPKYIKDLGSGGTYYLEDYEEEEADGEEIDEDRFS